MHLKIPCTTHGPRKKDEKRHQAKHDLLEAAGNEDKQEKTKNLRMEDEQGNDNLGVFFKLISLINNFSGDSGAVIIMDEKLQVYDIKKGPFRDEQHLFNTATYSNRLTDPRVFGPLYFPDSQIITMAMSDKAGLEVKGLYSQIMRRIGDEQAYSFAGNTSMQGNFRDLVVELTLQLLQPRLKDGMDLRDMYTSDTVSGPKQFHLDSKEERIGALHRSKQQLYSDSKISQIDLVQKQMLLQEMKEKIRRLSQTRYQGQQGEKPQKVQEDSKGKLKNYSSLGDVSDLGKYFNLYRGPSEKEGGIGKNEEEDSDFSITPLKPDVGQARDEHTSELLVLYQDHRHVLLLLSSQARGAPRIEEKIQLQMQMGHWDSSLPIRSPEHSFEGSQHGNLDLVDCYERKQKLKEVEEQEDFNSITNQATKVPDVKGKSNDELAIGQKGQKKDVDRPYTRHPLHGARGSLKICVAELGITQTVASSLRDTHSSGSDLYSSSYGEEDEEEDMSSFSGLSEDEIQQVEEEAHDSLTSSAKDGAVRDDHTQTKSEGTQEKDVLCDCESTPQCKSAGQSTAVDSELNDFETDGASLLPTDTRPSLPATRRPLTGETRAQTPPLHAPVQVSSPTASGHTSPSFSEHLENADGQIYENITSSAIFQQEYEHSSQLGACAARTPIVAQEEGHHFHYGTHPIDDRGPYIAEEAHFSFIRQENDQPRLPAQSLPHLVHHSARPQPQETSPAQPIAQPESCCQQSHALSTQPIVQSESFSPGSHAPVRLPPMTVHAAGSLPPWATMTARIDLSQAAARDYAQLRSRRATYEDDWPTHHSGIDPANMALAGFFRHGRGRRVRCFYCGLELDPSAHHNIWDEHVRYRPTCAYLRAVMGSDFVLQTQMRLGRQP
ncbi:uncharacterized protein [Littorina saxatilis]|uniref:Uncharacterized protein n=1 Tax=Littorina saxatilis TaxID=31220 RepID=A0AAN9GH64_9CAEN